MFHPSIKKFFLYGLAIAGLEEFITQGVLRGSYFLWIFTLIPFAAFLGIAGLIRAGLHRLATGWHAAVLYYVVTGGIGLAVEWFIIGLSPWSDRNSPLLLIALFHAGMFSFWGTVALVPHILLDARPEIAPLQRRLRRTWASLMVMTYALTFTAKAAHAPRDILFLASVGPVVGTFLTMNVFYCQYFRSCGQSTRLLPTSALRILIVTAVTLAAGTSDFARAGVLQSLPIRLRVAATTTFEIMLAWDPVPDATAYILQRSTEPSFDPQSTKTYQLPLDVTGYGDLGCEPHDATRFGPGRHIKEFDRRKAVSESGGRVGGKQYYRLQVRLPDGEVRTSEAVSASLAEKPIRGARGDLWADVVLGQPDFYNYNCGKLTRMNVNLAGGLAIDRTTKPNRVFLLDANNNRVLGLDHLGISSVTGEPATSEDDCPPGELLQLTPGKVEPSVLLGQPGPHTSAANGDATMQAFPGKAPASRSSLAVSRSGAVSPGETVVFVNLAVDAQHNLYVPDCYNHRVLMYRDPFAPQNDAAAEAVWGQGGDFTTHDPNKGGIGPSSLHLRDIMGIDVDAEGSLWIADAQNHRVLRFRQDPQTRVPRRDADFVLGQKDFHSAEGRAADELDRMFLPVGVRATPTRTATPGNRRLIDLRPAGHTSATPSTGDQPGRHRAGRCPSSRPAGCRRPSSRGGNFRWAGSRACRTA